MEDEQAPVMRTSPARTGKMMAILVGICVAGGAIFFGLWDYWISEAPPVVAMMSDAEAPQETGVFTGQVVPVSLSFVEAPNFLDYSFNEILGEPGANPDIFAEVGDRIEFSIVSEGVLLHAFGVTAEESGTGGIFPGSEVGSPNSPLTKGGSGTSEFVPPEEGVYYYICTVAGHREQGMVGRIIVGDVDVPAEVSEEGPASEAPAREAPDEPEDTVSETGGPLQDRQTPVAARGPGAAAHAPAQHAQHGGAAAV